MRISDWSSDVCSSDLALAIDRECGNDDDHLGQGIVIRDGHVNLRLHTRWRHFRQALSGSPRQRHGRLAARKVDYPEVAPVDSLPRNAGPQGLGAGLLGGKSLGRSEEHTSELQSLMRISYAVFCLKKKKTRTPLQQH